MSRYPHQQFNLIEANVRILTQRDRLISLLEAILLHVDTALELSEVDSFRERVESIRGVLAERVETAKQERDDLPWKYQSEKDKED